MSCTWNYLGIYFYKYRKNDSEDYQYIVEKPFKLKERGFDPELCEKCNKEDIPLHLLDEADIYNLSLLFFIKNNS